MSILEINFNVMRYILYAFYFFYFAYLVQCTHY